MRVLWLYRYAPNYNFDKWLHLEYVRHMRQLGYDVIAYGPELEKEYSDIMLTPFDPNLTWDQLIDLAKADIAILNTRSRAFLYYNPFTGEQSGCWLPKGFETSTRIKKILIDEDAHYERDDNWVHQNGFALTIQRHKAQVDRLPWKVRNVWLPFSVNTSIFKPSVGTPINKVCFTGSVTARYSDRASAIELLQRHHLIDVYSTGKKVGQDYINCLQQYICCLSGASDYNICSAKNLEIMASGAVLLTNNFTGLTDLFPADTYALYTNGSEDIITQAFRILGDRVYANSLRQRALEHIQANHTDEIRTKQLFEILEKEL